MGLPEAVGDAVRPGVPGAPGAYGFCEVYGVFRPYR